MTFWWRHIDVDTPITVSNLSTTLRFNKAEDKGERTTTFINNSLASLYDVSYSDHYRKRPRMIPHPLAPPLVVPLLLRELSRKRNPWNMINRLRFRSHLKPTFVSTVKPMYWVFSALFYTMIMYSLLIVVSGFAASGLASPFLSAIDRVRYFVCLTRSSIYVWQTRSAIFILDHVCIVFKKNSVAELWSATCGPNHAVNAFILGVPWNSRW